jgi:hypothetical protein
MQSERRNQIVLAILVGILVFALYRAWQPTAAPSPSASNGRSGRRQADAGAPEAPDVHIEALKAERTAPAETQRNLFRFRAQSAPVAQAPAGRSQGPIVAAPPLPTSTPGQATIALKFIGIVETGTESPRIAVLSDPRGVYYGREGDIIEGRYRIMRIGAESIELAHVDGSGRQTIRLTGS